MGSALTDRSTHYDFGKNWAEYSQHITPERIDQAVLALHRLVPDIAGKNVIDIGSGSGLPALAALKLGAISLTAVDIDEDSVLTTRRVLMEFAGDLDWNVRHASIFDLPEDEFDVVYSWGVLHHTGAMWDAIGKAASLVRPGGTFAFALYEKTPLCGAWTVEKRLYIKAPKRVQRGADWLYRIAYTSARLLSGKGVKKDDVPRGFTVAAAIPDWMGGYPYESTTLSEVDPFMRARGFELRSHNPAPVHAFGIFGSGCTEYVYVRS